MRAAMGKMLAACALAMLLVPAWPVASSSQEAKSRPASPVGGVQGAVAGNDGSAGLTLDPKQLEVMRSVNAYFNSFQSLKGNFTQTNSERQRLRGKFYVKRPGKLRFEYNLPSKQLIVSDGSVLQIKDLDIRTDDRMSIEQTPFRMLVRKEVDLLQDARILEVQEADDLVIVALQDRSPDAPGRIRLFMSKSPQLELKEWVTTDQQGKDTRVEVNNLAKDEDLNAELFKVVAPEAKPAGQ